jgi:DNA modification methylase
MWNSAILRTTTSCALLELRPLDVGVQHLAAPAVNQQVSSDLELEPVATAELAAMFAPYNPRQISDHDLEALRRSLRFFGTVEPIVANRRSGRIVGGHQRVKAAQAEGIESLPVAWVDLDDPSEKQLNLALNRISGDWDDAALREVLQALDAEGADLELTGFADTELARLLQTLTDGATDDDAVPSDVEKRCEPGDLWQLGDHRLLCGDATNAEDVARVLDGATPLLCVTDPPYGVEYDAMWRETISHAAGRRGGKVTNDDRADWREAWALFSGDVLYSWTAPGPPAIQAGIGILETNFDLRNQLMWRKSNFPISRGHYTYQHESCWYAVKKGRKAHWIGDHNASSVWEVSLDRNVEGGHSTQKPVELFTRAIGNHQGDVYEPFCGSGTGLVASEKLDRKCYALEISPEYCDVILQRWEQFTERKAERL